MMRFHHLLSVMLSVMLIPVFSAFGETPGTLLSEADLQMQEQLFDLTRPLLEAAVAASISIQDGPDGPVEYDEGIRMEDAYAASLLGLRDLDPALQQDTDDRTWLETNFALVVPDLLPATVLPSGLHTGLMLLDLTLSPDPGQFAVRAEVYQAPVPYNELSDEDWDELSWLDMMAILILREDPQAATGWKICSLHYTPTYFADDTDMEQPDDLSAAGDTWIGMPSPADSAVSVISVISYYNERYGYAVCYPALFTEDLLNVNEDGLDATLADQSASVHIGRIPLQGRSMDGIVQEEIVAHAGAILLSTELDGMACLEYDQDTRKTRWFCSLSADAVICVSLSWDTEVHADLADLADLMMQSLIVEVDSLG